MTGTEFAVTGTEFGARVALAFCREEIPQQRRGAALVDAAIDLGAVVAGGLAEDARALLDAAAFGVLGAEIEPADASKRDCLGAHRTGLQSDI